MHLIMLINVYFSTDNEHYFRASLLQYIIIQNIMLKNAGVFQSCLYYYRCTDIITAKLQSSMTECGMIMMMMIINEVYFYSIFVSSTSSYHHHCKTLHNNLKYLNRTFNMMVKVVYYGLINVIALRYEFVDKIKFALYFHCW